MLRRKKDTMLNGKPLIVLPDRIVNIVACTFDDDEREFYDAIQSKVDLTLNKFMKNGNMAINYTSVLVLLLRLRQGSLFILLFDTISKLFSLACNHPSLISKDFTADKDAVDPRSAKEDEADELADLFGAMGVSSKRKCQMCQNEYVPVTNSFLRYQHYFLSAFPRQIRLTQN